MHRSNHTGMFGFVSLADVIYERTMVLAQNITCKKKNVNFTEQIRKNIINHSAELSSWCEGQFAQALGSSIRIRHR